MAEAIRNSEPSMQFNHRLVELLQDPNTNGVFIGESHGNPALRQSLGYLMNQSKANGVRTVSIEVSQGTIDSIIRAKSQREWLNIAYARQIEEYARPAEIYNLVMTAHRAGMKVLGHEDPNRTAVMLTQLRTTLIEHYPREIREIDNALERITDPAERIEEQYKRITPLLSRAIRDHEALRTRIVAIIGEHNGSSDANMRHRNEYAANHINTHKLPGKVLVLGGRRHASGDSHSPVRWPHSPSTLRDGLDSRLNLSAILISDSNNGRVGDTHRLSGIPGDGTPGMPNRPTFDVILPADLRQFVKDHHITQWPPQGGIPTLSPAVPAPPALPRVAPPQVPMQAPRSP